LTDVTGVIEKVGHDGKGVSVPKLQVTLAPCDSAINDNKIVMNLNGQLKKLIGFFEKF
jgi:hypothetical protein